RLRRECIRPCAPPGAALGFRSMTHNVAQAAEAALPHSLVRLRERIAIASGVHVAATWRPRRGEDHRDLPQVEAQGRWRFPGQSTTAARRRNATTRDLQAGVPQ